MTTSLNSRRALGALRHGMPTALTSLLLLGTVACGDSAEVIDAPAGTGGTGGGAPNTDPLYVVSTTVFSGEEAQGYLVPVTSLDPGTTFDLTNAIEAPDNTIAARPGEPYLYVGSSETPTITRWDLQDNGSLVEGPSLSLANLGLSRASVSNELMYSAEKAYIPDDANHQVVIWNPKTMEIVTTLDLGVAAEGTLLPWMWITVRPDVVLVTVSWEGDFENDWSVFGDHVSVIAIDPVTNAILSTTTDPRCNYLFWGSQASDGTAYYSPLSYYTPIRSMLGDERGVESCALRVPPAGKAFDDAYELDLSSLVGGRPAGNLFLVSDDVALIRVWHSELVTPLTEDKSNWEDVINEAGFLWWRWQLDSPTAEQIPDQLPGASEITGAYRVDNRNFLPRVSADYSSTTLDEVNENGEFVPVLTGPGNIWGVVKMR